VNEAQLSLSTFVATGNVQGEKTEVRVSKVNDGLRLFNLEDRSFTDSAGNPGLPERRPSRGFKRALSHLSKGSWNFIRHSRKL
jgi:hypothetical protein